MGEKTQDGALVLDLGDEGEIDQVQLTSIAVSPADIPMDVGFETPEPLLIGLAGKKRSGKDSVMLMLNLELRDIEDEHAVVMPMSFAAPLKQLAKDMYGWTGKKDAIGRWLLQKLGTEKIRAEHPDFWVESAERRLRDAIRTTMFPPALIVFTDARFVNEADWIKKRGGEMWKIVRLEYEETVESGSKEVLERHASETGLDNYKDWDAILRAKDLDQLYEKVKGQLIRLRREGKLGGL